MSVELRHLRALVAVADTATFTDAAAVLEVSQPTLSRTIAQLEQVVGRALVERTTRQVSLTPAGAGFVVDARAVLGRLDRALTALAGRVGEPLRIGWTWAAFGDRTAPLLRAWKDSGGVPVEVVRTRDPFAALDADELDAAIVRKALPDEVDYERYQSAHLYAERLVVGLSVDHPLAQRGSLLLSDLVDERVALCSTTPTATLALWEGQQRAPAALDVEGTDEWLARIVLQESVGVTSVATSYNYPHPEIRYLPLADSPTVEVQLVWPVTERHTEVEAFARFARAYFRQAAV